MVVITGETPVKNNSAIFGNSGNVNGILRLPIIATSYLDGTWQIFSVNRSVARDALESPVGLGIGFREVLDVAVGGGGFVDGGHGTLPI